jgi:tRNA(fMet)-specific endonuclease VapC
MTLKFLLDTTIVSAPVAKIPNRRVVRKLEQQSDHCAIAAPVWHELVYGCSRLPAGKRKSALEEYLHGVVRRSFPTMLRPNGTDGRELGSKRAGERHHS